MTSRAEDQARRRLRKRLLRPWVVWVCVLVFGVTPALLAVALFLLVQQGEQRPISERIAEKATDVTAAKLLADYRENEARAGATHRGKPLRVRGVIGRVGEGGVELTAGGLLALEVVACDFDQGDRPELLPLARGSEVAVTGLCTGGFAGRVRLEHCRLVK